ncbi:MAG: cyclophilin-like fold protein [Abditibacteriales bacterium]|nr:cyclophilin-like fold protein [Abditibacteriales bacterium]MDW8368339.1 cyclophilin-like fold protein [Abditibacteriales bacterium]
MQRIKITAGSVVALAELNDTDTARRIYAALPLTGRAQTWGDEIYFSIPVQCPVENAQEVVALGDLGYWPPGAAFCIFFGPTPASHGDEIRPASAVNVFGKVVGDAKVFKHVRAGEAVKVEKAESEPL